jgi:hypothetical protein
MRQGCTLRALGSATDGPCSQLATRPNAGPRHGISRDLLGLQVLEFGAWSLSSFHRIPPPSLVPAPRRRRPWLRTHETPGAPCQTAAAGSADAGDTNDNSTRAGVCVLAMSRAEQNHPDQRFPHHRLAAHRRRLWRYRGHAQRFGRCSLRGARVALLDPLRHPLGLAATVYKAGYSGVGRRQGRECACPFPGLDRSCMSLRTCR